LLFDDHQASSTIAEGIFLFGSDRYVYRHFVAFHELCLVYSKQCGIERSSNRFNCSDIAVRDACGVTAAFTDIT
jgi:hypothetical protein